MSFLETIVDSINTLVKDGLIHLGPVDVHGIADIAARQKDGDQFEYLPCVIDNDGEARYVGADDCNAIQIYHRAWRSRLIDKPGGQQYGNKNTNMVSQTTVSMIVTAWRGKIRKTGFELSDIILGLFPAEVIKLRDRESNEIVCRTTVKPATDINFNSVELFSREYRNTEYFIKPGMLFFEIAYIIESEFDRSCFNTCNNCND